MQILNQPDIAAVFFDLDGTLLDTAPDLACACNAVLKQYQRPATDLHEFRQWIHGGAAMMIKKSFNIPPQHPEFPAIKTAFIEHYRQRMTVNTELFAGMDKTLNYLEQHNILWGIVTNKHANLVEPILSHFGLSQRCCCVVSGDTLPQTKPHPAPLLYACQLIHCHPSRAVYVGDTLTDMQAAHAAGMIGIAATYGYHPADSQPRDWPAAAFIESPRDLIDLMQPH